MTTSKKQQKAMNGRPMHEWVYLSIMGEYLICPDEYLENPRIQKAYAMNDEAMLRKFLNVSIDYEIIST